MPLPSRSIWNRIGRIPERRLIGPYFISLLTSRCS